MILATVADQSAIAAFLRAHLATSMFPLSNLARYGMAGGHPRSQRFWLRWRAGEITDVVALTQEGGLFPQCPTGHWGDVAAVLSGEKIKSVLGDTTQVTAVRAALGLQKEAALDHAEPLYQLALPDLFMPDVAGFDLRPLSAAPLALVEDWRAAYCAEVLPVPGEDVVATAKSDIAGYLGADSHRVLFEGEEPVAMTGFNATESDVVQLGGVYTPPAARSRGLARRAVALHLAEARAKGARRAILFAASSQASRAYESVGFAQTGQFSIVVYETPQVVSV